MRHSSITHLLVFLSAVLVSVTAGSAQISNGRAGKPDSSFIPSPQVWLRADLGKLSPTLWPDKSGNQRNTTALPEEGPLKGGKINFNQALIFDGINDYMKIPYSVEGLSAITIMAVFKSADTTERGVWASEKAPSRNMMLSTRRVAGPDSVIDLYGKHENTAVISTIVQQWTKSINKPEEAYFALGSSGKERSGKPFKGVMAEVIIFDGALPYLERQQFETYLSIKYGITLLNGNYVGSARQVLWDREKNKSFAYRITGIGRDDAFGLIQKQSQSVHDTTGFLTLSAGAIAPFNSENKTPIDNHHFLLWADNGMPLTGKASQQTDTSLSILERKWLMNVNGISASKLPTTLQVNISVLEKDSLGYWLVIDRSGQGNFSIDNVEYITADSLSQDKKTAFFRKLRWDTDGSGSDIFSFARAKAMFAPITSLTHPICNNPSLGSIISKVIGGKVPFQYELSCNQTGLYRKWNDGGSLVQGDLHAGDCLLKITDASSRVIERRFTLKAPATLRVDLGEDQQLVQGKAIELNAASYIPDSVDVSYSWENNFGFRSKEAKVSITQSGIYTTKVTTPDGCTYSDEIIISGTVAQRFDLLPNIIRSGGTYHVSISLEGASPVSVKVYDMKGNTFEEMKGNSGTEYHFRGTIKGPGMYMILLQTPKGIETRKLIVN